MKRSIGLVDTQVANLHSLKMALERAALSWHLVTDPRGVESASHLVLPGVGRFAAAMQRLTELGICEALRQRIAANQPTLAICLGMQLLARASEESPDVQGLGVFDAVVRRLPGDQPLPQLGWNAVVPEAAGADFPFGHAWFANSYGIFETPAGWQAASTRYGGTFLASLWRGNVLACQFHPELSGAWGEQLLRNWVARTSGLTRRVLPCLDVRNGRVVKGVRFANLRDAGDPAALAAAYCEQGADELVMLDVSATLEERLAIVDTIRSIRSNINIPLTVGGGVRNVEDAARLLDSGADKVSINSAAVDDPQLIEQLSQRFGAQCTVLAVDARCKGDGWEVMTRGGTRAESLDAVEWVAAAEARGAGEILLTSHDRDGTGAGYDLALLQAVRTRTHLPVIASGGARTVAHLAEAFDAGAHAVLAASIFHDQETTVGEVKRQLSRLGVAIRI